MTYEYKCKACGHCWECEQKISEPALKKCPECNKNQAQRLISGGLGFQLQGGGVGWGSNGYSGKD
jgi:putative FmdB family regulatory protein